MERQTRNSLGIKKNEDIIILLILPLNLKF